METDHLHFANTNSLWASFLVDALFRLGLRHAVVAPGSRSAPLAYALAQHPGLRATPILDERSASFFALGLAKRTRRPVVLVCTSGTAAANFFPAVIEARESRVPLLILTADRPPEMRECGSGQTIDQVKLFGHYPRWQAELAVPEATEKMLAYLRQTITHACHRALGPVPGPVHLNLPFRDPLAPIPDGSLDSLDHARINRLLADLVPLAPRDARPSSDEVRHLAQRLAPAQRLLIVAGPIEAADPEAYLAAVFTLARPKGALVLADALSPVRQYCPQQLPVIGNYDSLLERGQLPSAPPDLVIRLGPLPTSKRLRRWLEGLDCPHLVVDEGDANVDPLHGRTIHIHTGLEALVADLPPSPDPKPGFSCWADSWLQASNAAAAETALALEQCEEMFEGKIPWLLAQHAPAGAVVFISNSTPIRDAEYFWPTGAMAQTIYFNRGANGIDGILSTAMGIASEASQTFLITGELAFLHDQNGLLNARAVSGGLTILLINNHGGGIFRALPVAQFDPPFNDFFLTPQKVDFPTLSAAHGIPHQVITDWKTLIAAIQTPWTQGLRVLEIPTHSAADHSTRLKLLKNGTYHP